MWLFELSQMSPSLLPSSLSCLEVDDQHRVLGIFTKLVENGLTRSSSESGRLRDRRRHSLLFRLCNCALKSMISNEELFEGEALRQAADLLGAAVRVVVLVIGKVTVSYSVVDTVPR